MEVKALACELPATLGIPLSRLSTADIAREVKRSGIVATISDKTVWRWLSEDAIRPWHHRSWIFPRDPDFAPQRTDAFWICMPASGRASHWRETHS